MELSPDTKDWIKFIWNEFLILITYSFFFGTEYGLASLIKNVIGEEAVSVAPVATLYEGIRISLTILLLFAWGIHGTLTFIELLRRHWNSFRGKIG